MPKEVSWWTQQLRWPHWQADQVWLLDMLLFRILVAFLRPRNIILLGEVR